MIVCVCLNPALDVTYRVPRLRPGDSHRVERVGRRVGGKATNVARVLTQLGAEVTLIAPLGAKAAAAFADELDARTIVVETAGRIRTTVTVIDDAGATLFSEPGVPLSSDEWAAIRGAVSDAARDSDVVVLAGSIPPAVPDDAYAQLTRIACDGGAAAIVDAHGSALASALRAGPEMVAPNVHEARATLAITADNIECAAELRRLGAGAAVVSDGPAGVAAATTHGDWRASPPEQLGGNPTGAGDALTAALALGCALGTPWPELLRDAVAVSAAALAVDVAGGIDIEVRDALRSRVRVEEVARAARPYG